MTASTTLGRARSFVAAAALPAAAARPATARRSRGAAADDTVGVALQSGKQQAAVVGSDLVSFATAVDSGVRQDLINCSLLAQLVAKKKVPDPSRIFDWYDAYFDALQQIGWAVQDRGFAIYVEQSQNFSAHDAILKVADALLMPSAGSVALVKTTLQALQSMQADSPWITIFNRESRQASTARFQISLAEQAGDGGLSVALMAFGLEAKASLTQVLLFKASSNQATLRHCSAKVAINTELLAQLRPDLSAKLAQHASSYIKALPDF